jgi:hypothetical protein
MFFVSPLRDVTVQWEEAVLCLRQLAHCGGFDQPQPDLTGTVCLRENWSMTFWEVSWKPPCNQRLRVLRLHGGGGDIRMGSGASVGTGR